MQNLLCLINHLHLFLGIKVIKEDINLRNQVKSNRIMLRQACGRQDMRLHLTALAVSLRLVGQLVNALLAGTGNSLVGRNNKTLDACQIIERLQSHHHDNSRAVRVSDNAFMLENILRINLGHNQRHLRIHTEGAGVINNNSASLHSIRSELLRNAAACKQSNVNAFEGILRCLLNSIGLAHELNLLTCAALRSQKTQLCKREISLLN